MSLCSQAVILAGGLGTRLKPITETVPKSIVEVAGRPFLFYQLDLLLENGISKVLLLVGHMGEQIEKAVNESTYRDKLVLEFSYDGETALGTAGSIGHAISKLDESFFVLYGDSYLHFPYQEAYQKFLLSKKSGLMTIFRNENEWDASNVEFDGMAIVDYSKTNRTSRMHHIDYGLSVFKKSVFEMHVPRGVAYDLSQVMTTLLKAGQLDGYEVSNRFYEIGSPTGLREFENFVKLKG